MSRTWSQRYKVYPILLKVFKSVNIISIRAFVQEAERRSFPVRAECSQSVYKRRLQPEVLRTTDEHPVPNVALVSSMPSSWMCNHVALERIDVSEEDIASIVVFLRSVLQLLVTANVVPSSLILSI
jgi:hypothetical protein